MKVIHQWLGDYLPRFNSSPEKLTSLLTGRAVEVEAMSDLREQLQPIVVGKILTVAKHPDADRLRVAKVTIGSKRLSIVCGAPNIYAGMFVAVAQSGTETIDMQTGAWRKLEPAKIRGVDSQGMIVGADELGLATGAAAHQERQVMDLSELAQDTDVGKSIINVVDVSPMYDLDVLANRPDLMGHRGVAKEIAGLLKLKYQAKQYHLPKPTSKKAPLSIQVQAKRLVPVYSGLVLSGIKFGPSPAWMQNRLRRVGIRPISLVVDVTNYVMMDLGQPLHAFDLDQVKGLMRVRESKKGEKIKTLDGKAHALPAGALVIEDKNGLIDLAGIMGGASSMITDQTQRIFLQAAVFDPQRIRLTARALGHRTEASARYERGVAPVLAEQALAMAFDLLKQSIPELKLEYKIDLNQPITPKAPVVIRTTKTNSLLGSHLTTQQIADVLKSLDIAILEKTADSLKVRPPVERLDLRVEEDAIEEVGRYMDYNTLPKTAPLVTLASQPTNNSIKLRPTIFSALTSAGWSEVMQLSFTNAAQVKKIGLSPAKQVQLENPMSEDQALLRSELLSSLLLTLGQQQRFLAHPQIFELAHVFMAQGQNQAEIPHFTGVTCGANSFTQVKGAVETILQRLHIEDVQFVPASHWAFEHDACLELKLGKESLGFVGQVKIDLAEALELEQACAGFELSYDQLIHAASPRFAYQEIPTFPSIVLDIAVVIPEAIQWHEVEEVVRQSGGEWLVSVEPFDVYTGDPIPKGKKNLAFRVEFQAKARTLEMTEAEAAREKIVSGLKAKWGANLR